MRFWFCGAAIIQVAVTGIGIAGLAGLIIDRANGRGFRHFPDEISVALEPLR